MKVCFQPLSLQTSNFKKTKQPQKKLLFVACPSIGASFGSVNLLCRGKWTCFASHCFASKTCRWKIRNFDKNILHQKLSNFYLQTFVWTIKNFDFNSPLEKKPLELVWTKFYPPKSCFVSFLLQSAFSELYGKEFKKFVFLRKNFNFKAQIEIPLSVWCDFKRKRCTRDWTEEWTCASTTFREVIWCIIPTTLAINHPSENLEQFKQNEIMLNNTLWKRGSFIKRKYKIWFEQKLLRNYFNFFLKKIIIWYIKILPFIRLS